MTRVELVCWHMCSYFSRVMLFLLTPPFQLASLSPSHKRTVLVCPWFVPGCSCMFLCHTFYSYLVRSARLCVEELRDLLALMRLSVLPLPPPPFSVNYVFSLSKLSCLTSERRRRHLAIRWRFGCRAAARAASIAWRTSCVSSTKTHTCRCVRVHWYERPPPPALSLSPVLRFYSQVPLTSMIIDMVDFIHIPW